MKKLWFVLAIAWFCMIFQVTRFLGFYQQTPMNAVSITNSQVNSTPIGNAAPASGNFSQITGPLNWSYIQSKPYPVAGQNWNYTSGGGGQPSWLWGTNDGQTMQIWNPGNFSVNYANSAGGAPWTGISGTPAVTQWQWNWSAQSGSPPY